MKDKKNEIRSDKYIRVLIYKNTHRRLKIIAAKKGITFIKLIDEISKVI